ncbi:MAG: hypothetical protein EU530_00200 [Promethearchaeota archaeon]|nr:MAG: hypothetical protein EU530_00200 [Candidatus Lokiarchaeota archaeon]
MATKSPKTPEEEPDRFLKIMQFQSWFFVGILLIDVLIIAIRGLTLGNGLFGGLTDESLLIGLFCMIGTGLSFGLSYQIQATPARRKNLFQTYYISIALVGIIAIFVLAAYQW